MAPDRSVSAVYLDGPTPSIHITVLIVFTWRHPKVIHLVWNQFCFAKMPYRDKPGPIFLPNFVWKRKPRNEVTITFTHDLCSFWNRFDLSKTFTKLFFSETDNPTFTLTSHCSGSAVWRWESRFELLSQVWTSVSDWHEPPAWLETAVKKIFSHRNALCHCICCWSLYMRQMKHFFFIFLSCIVVMQKPKRHDSLGKRSMKLIIAWQDIHIQLKLSAILSNQAWN